MKTKLLTLLILLGLSAAPLSQAGDERKFGDAQFIAFQGDQKIWPTGEGTMVIRDYAVPIFIGLPKVKYTVLGRIYDPRTGPFGIVGRGLAEGLFSESDRRRDCARLAQYRGGQALLVTSHERIVKAFNLSLDEIEKTAPLFEHKDKLVLVIKFETDIAAQE